jgi:hypothetical protein
MPATLTTLIGWRRCSPRTTRAVNRSIPVVISSGVRRCFRIGYRCSRGVPDFSSELVASAVNGETEWGESYWRGHHTDGSAFAMRGVVRDGLVVEGRLYMEPVEVDSGDIDVAVQELYKPPS